MTELQLAATIKELRDITSELRGLLNIDLVTIPEAALKMKRSPALLRKFSKLGLKGFYRQGLGEKKIHILVNISEATQSISELGYKTK